MIDFYAQIMKTYQKQTKILRDNSYKKTPCKMDYEFNDVIFDMSPEERDEVAQNLERVGTNIMSGISKFFSAIRDTELQNPGIFDENGIIINEYNKKMQKQDKQD